MRHSVSISIEVDGDIDEVLTSIRSIVGKYSVIEAEDNIKVTGINVQQEYDYPAGMSTAEPEVEEPTQSLAEEQDNGREES